MAKKSLEELISTDRLDAGLLAVLMEYLKHVSREAREDRKLARADEELLQKAKAAKLALDNQKIDQGMEEAKEKATRAMEAARIAMVTGIVSGATAITVAIPVDNGVGKKSDLSQLQIRHQEEEIEKAAKRVAESRADAEASRDHKRAIADSIQKLLDKLAEVAGRP